MSGWLFKMRASRVLPEDPEQQTFTIIGASLLILPDLNGLARSSMERNPSFLVQSQFERFIWGAARDWFAAQQLMPYQANWHWELVQINLRWHSFVKFGNSGPKLRSFAKYLRKDLFHVLRESFRGIAVFVSSSSCRTQTIYLGGAVEHPKNLFR